MSELCDVSTDGIVAVALSIRDLTNEFFISNEHMHIGCPSCKLAHIPWEEWKPLKEKHAILTLDLLPPFRYQPP